MKINPAHQTEKSDCCEDGIYMVDNESFGALENWFLRKEQNDTCIVSDCTPEVLLKACFPEIIFVKAAGGIVLNSQQEMLFFKKRGFWDLPKGHCDKGENIEDTALREVSEETGLKHPEIIRHLGSTWHCYFDDNKSFLKQTVWFEMFAGSFQRLKADKREGISSLRFVNRQQLGPILKQSHRSIREFIKDNYN